MNEALELSQSWLETLLPSRRWILWEIATSGHIKNWAYQDICENLLGLSAAKQCIPRGRQKKYVHCWDKECQTLYHFFTKVPVPVGTDSDRAVLSLGLLSGLEQNRRSRRDRTQEEAVNSIDFPHSSCKTWRTINKLTLLAVLDAPLACAPSQQTPLPRYSWRTRHTGPGAASPPGSSTSNCPTQVLEDSNNWGPQYL